MKSSWHILREFLDTHVLAEERMYRGETGLRLKDIEALYDVLGNGDGDSHGQPYSSDPKVKVKPNPEGDMVVCQFPASSRVWGRWSRSPNFASIFSSTDRDQEPGKARGHTVVKQSYGGRVMNAPGKAKTDFERMPSAMDRYDVVMVGEVNGGAIPIPQTGNVMFPSRALQKGQEEPSIVVQKIAFSPAIGSAEERQGRLQALLSGQQPPRLARRPQPHVPEPTSRPEDPKHHSHNPPARDVPRATGGNMGLGTSARRNKGG